jgi:hypothetical protein
MVRFRCESGVRIKILESGIQESGSICIRISFCMIRESGPRPDPELFAFSISMSFFDGSGSEDPDPGSRLTQQLYKQF